MAQRYCQSQADQLQSKGGVRKICFQLAHLAALPQHQDAQTVQFRQGKACRIGVVQDVSAVPVVVAVRNTTPHFVELGCPLQFSFGPFAAWGGGLPEQRAGRGCHALGMGGVYCESLHERIHGGGAQVCFRLLAIQQVVECALAQCSLSHLHFFDFEQIKHGAEHTDTPANHRTSIFFQPLHAHAVGTLGAQQLFVQSIQTRTGDQSFRASHGRQDVPNRPGCARRSVSNLPGISLENGKCFVHYRLGSNFCSQEGLRGECSVRKIPRRPCHATHPVGCNGIG